MIKLTNEEVKGLIEFLEEMGQDEEGNPQLKAVEVKAYLKLKEIDKLQCIAWEQSKRANTRTTRTRFLEEDVEGVE